MAKRILVVDDEPDIRRLVAEALEVTGYDVQTAANGGEAVRTAGLYLPDLVLLDIMMPDMDGFTVYEKLREKPVRAALADHLPHGAAGDQRQAPRLREGRRGLHHQAVPHQGTAGAREGPPG